MTSPALASRPWRNNNPGDLRTLAHGERWYGQVAVDNAHGGPFAIFDTRANGWRALAMNLIQYQVVHGLDTIRGMIGRWAPAFENNTGGYVSGVAEALHISADAKISVHDPATLIELAKAIARIEGGAGLSWPPAEIVQGIYSVLGKAVPTGAVPAAPVVLAGPVVHHTAPMQNQEGNTAALNDASFKGEAP